MSLDAMIYRMNRKVKTVEELDKLELKAVEKPEALDFKIKKIYEEEGEKGVLEKLFKTSLTTTQDMLFLDYRIHLAIENVEEYESNCVQDALKDENIDNENYETIVKETMCYWSRHGDLQRYMTTLYRLRGNTGDINYKNIILEKEDLITLITIAKLAIKGEYTPTEVGFNWENTHPKDWERTIESIEEILETTDFENETIYYYSWW